MRKQTNRARWSKIVDSGCQVYASPATVVCCKLRRLRSSSEHLGERDTTRTHKNRRTQRVTRCEKLLAADTELKRKNQSCYIFKTIMTLYYLFLKHKWILYKRETILQQTFHTSIISPTNESQETAQLAKHLLLWAGPRTGLPLPEYFFFKFALFRTKKRLLFDFSFFFF